MHRRERQAHREAHAALFLIGHIFTTSDTSAKFHEIFPQGLQIPALQTVGNSP
jgi:hypothetical protein